MQSKVRKLPILQPAKNKSTFIKDRHKIEDLLLENARNRGSNKDYRHQQQFSQIRATNFLSRVETIDSPHVIFSIADQIKQISSSNLKQNQRSKAQCQLKKELLNRSEIKRINQQRQQALNLGKWMDEKLKKFKAKTSITFMDILEYKQTILNYSLGKIIDSLSKKCKEQGQLLSLIWNNTFVMFEGVFNILIDANKQKEKDKINQAKQLHCIFEINHNFLKQQNEALKTQNKAIFEKMKNVILWNKRLRKDRKQLFIRNRVLQYRLQSYTQSLQQTVKMLLQSVAQPATIQTAKKIIQKLGRERNRKRNFNKRDSDEEFTNNIKEMVYNWLKNNSYLNEDIFTFLNDSKKEKQSCFIFEEIKDHNQMNKVDIYDFFKLYDMGVQVSAETTSTFSQVQQKEYKNVEVMTRKLKTIEHSCQTVGKIDQSQNVDQVEEKKQPSIKSRQNTRVKDNLTRAASKQKMKINDVVSQKSLQNVNANKNADFQVQKYEKMNERRIQRQKYKRASNKQYSQNVKLQKLSEQDDEYKQSKDYEINSLVLKQSKKQSNIYERGISVKKDKSQFQNSSLSEYQQIQNGKKEIATKFLITNCSFKGRQKSMRDIPDIYSGSSKNLQLRKKRAERKSMTFATASSQRKIAIKLNSKKKFNEAYKQNSQFMKKNSQQFLDQIVRRRSFYSKKRVQFCSLQAAEETTQKIRDYLRGNKPTHLNYYKSFYESANYVSSNIQNLSKKFVAPTNIQKTKILLSAQNVFTSITQAIQKMARLPPKNKVFVNNSLSMITKYIQQIIPDYLKQIRRQKQELISDFQKALYPLNILVMEKMSFKYGLKDIAQKKIKNFIQKVIMLAPISQKIGLYSILLGLQDSEVGSDELLVYLKCLVYFDPKKTIRETTNTDSSKVDLDVVHQNLRKILEYFFDLQYINLVELKLQMYLQHNCLSATVEGIATIIVKELLKRKKDMKEKYLKMHEICSYGDNFYTNMFNLLKIYANYQSYALNQVESQFKQSKKVCKEKVNQSLQTLQRVNRREKVKKAQVKSEQITYDINKISGIIKELLQRSDIIDQEYGKSITAERFVTAAVICGVPTFHQFEKIINYLTRKFGQIKVIHPIYESLNCSDWRGVEKLEKLWSKSSVGKSDDQVVNRWSISKMYAEKIQEQVIRVMGVLGAVGLYIQSNLFNIGICA